MGRQRIGHGHRALVSVVSNELCHVCRICNRHTQNINATIFVALCPRRHEGRQSTIGVLAIRIHKLRDLLQRIRHTLYTFRHIGAGQCCHHSVVESRKAHVCLVKQGSPCLCNGIGIAVSAPIRLSIRNGMDPAEPLPIRRFPQQVIVRRRDNVVQIQLTQTIGFLAQNLHLELGRAPLRNHLLVGISHLLVQRVKTDSLRALDCLVIHHLLDDLELGCLEGEQVARFLLLYHVPPVLRPVLGCGLEERLDLLFGRSHYTDLRMVSHRATASSLNFAITFSGSVLVLKRTIIFGRSGCTIR